MSGKKFMVAGSITVAALFGLAIPVHAEIESNATSHGNVKLIPDSGGVVTPPIDPGGGGETGNKGQLTIDNVTSLEFSMHTIVNGEVQYATTSTNPNVQVTDNRGVGQGWSLKVTAGAFVDKSNASKTLKGTYLIFPVGTLVTVGGNVSEKPDTHEVKVGTSERSAQVIMDAKEGDGLGTWEDKFDPSRLKIDVPSGNLAGDYSAELTWALEDAPQ